MPTFLAERYVARGDLAGFALDADRARRGAEEVSREGTSVRFLRSLFVPEEETCLYVYEAPSADAVREAARRATLRFDRVNAAIADTSVRPAIQAPERRLSGEEHR
jgi:hypothetical protein